MNADRIPFPEVSRQAAIAFIAIIAALRALMPSCGAPPAWAARPTKRICLPSAPFGLLFPLLALQRRFKRGKSKSALPPTSDVDLYGEIVVDLKCSGSHARAVRHRIFLWSNSSCTADCVPSSVRITPAYQWSESGYHRVEWPTSPRWYPRSLHDQDSPRWLFCLAGPPLPGGAHC